MRHLTPKSGELRYDVEIAPVREVSLLASADWDFWQARLAPHGLRPAELEGQAQILIIAAEMRFKGILFRELSISVFVSATPEGDVQDAVFLPCAFNSIGAFAWVERTFFRTPYYGGNVAVQAEPRPSFSVEDRHGGLLSAALDDADFARRSPDFDQYHGWAGPIFLPPIRKPNVAGDRLFFAKIGGHTRAYAWNEHDRLTIRPSPRQPIFQWLIDSRLSGRQWFVRPNGAHGKSKTLARSQVELQPLPA